MKGCLVGKEITQVGCGDGFTVVATSDNQVFSWGCGDNGRLGVNPNILGGKQSSGVPRPIFGSLHKVASLKCRHWHTIILGERVHGSKVIQKTASFPDSMLSSSGLLFITLIRTSTNVIANRRQPLQPQLFFCVSSLNLCPFL